MDIVKINLNETVKFKLTDHGKDIYYHQYDELNELIKARGGKPLKPSMPRVDKDGYTKMQLWCFFELYGDHIGMTMPNVIEPLEILYTDSCKKDNGWISVEERLPEDGETVLTISSELEMEVYDYDSEWEGIFQKFNGSIKVFNITHWMPLPEAPKIEGGSNDT